MQKIKTHFEQVPVKVVKTMIEAQQIKNEFPVVTPSVEKVLPLRKGK